LLGRASAGGWSAERLPVVCSAEHLPVVYPTERLLVACSVERLFGGSVGQRPHQLLPRK
jgi:hypothetical protein